jgi:hypothetical protein
MIPSYLPVKQNINQNYAYKQELGNEVFYWLLITNHWPLFSGYFFLEYSLFSANPIIFRMIWLVPS